MNKRPRSVTMISWLFIGVGVVALSYHLQPQHIAELKTKASIANELVWVCLVRLLAIVAGVFMLLGFNWARWLLVVWVAYHVVLSAFHSWFEVVVHTLLFGVIVSFLFLPRASRFFLFRRNGLKPRPGAVEEDV